MSSRAVHTNGVAPSEAAQPTNRVELPPLLAGPALETAERWAARVLSQLQQQSRRICGGWPGTFSEARALVSVDLHSQLTGKSLEELERVGHDQVARFLYHGARQYWTRRERRCGSKHDTGDPKGTS